MTSTATSAAELGDDRDLDPVTLSVILGKLESINRQMTATMERTARSPVFKLAHDYSNGIFNAHGDLVVQGNDLPIHLGSLASATRTVIHRFGDTARPGDVYYHNDPVSGGSHLQDMCVFTPVFVEGELAFWAANKAHMDDTGGVAPGGYNPFAEDMYAEGIRIGPLRIHEAGEPREDLIEMLVGNVRNSGQHRGDMSGQLAALSIAERGLVALAGRYGTATVLAATDRLMDIGEARMRAAIGEMANGVYEGSAVIEATNRTPELEIVCQAEVRDDSLRIRLSAPEQVAMYMNSYWGNTISAIYFGVLILSGVKEPINSGTYRPLEVELGEPGSVTNASYPAPCGLCTTTPGDNITDAVVAALTPAIPRRTNAGWCHAGGTSQNGIDPRTGEFYNFNQVIGAGGGAGAVVGIDGWHCGVTRAAGGGIMSGDVELLEAEFPIHIHRWELRRDSGGPGRWRGGLGADFEVEPVDHDATFVLWGEGEKHPAIPVLGASSKDPELRLSRRFRIDTDGNRVPLDWHASYKVVPGERYLAAAGGGGGVGHPFERDAEQVAADVRNGLVSAARARADYGVEVGADGKADHDATGRLRAGNGA